MAFRYLTLTKNHAKKSTNFLLKTLGVKERTHVHVCHDEVDTIRDIVHECLNSKMSSALVDQDGNIVAQVLNANYYELEQFTNENMDISDPVNCFLEKTRHLYFPKDPVNTLYTFAVSVDHFYNKKRLSTYIVDNMIINARKHGYESIITDCTDREYQAIFNTAGFQTKAIMDHLMDHRFLKNHIIDSVIHMEKNIGVKLIV